MEQSSVRIIACPSLAFEHGKIDRYVPEGGTIADHLRALGWQPDSLNARVTIDGVWIEQAQWEYAVPRAGQAFVTRVIPMGGGENGKSALRIAAMLAIVVASIYTGQFYGAAAAAYIGVSAAVGTAVVTAVTSIALTLAMTARIPPARPRLCDQRQVSHV